MSKKMSTWFMTQTIAFRDVTVKFFDMGLNKFFRYMYLFTFRTSFNMFNFIVEGVLLTIVSTFGFIGNIMSIIVLTKTIRKSRNRSFRSRTHGQVSFSL